VGVRGDEEDLSLRDRDAAVDVPAAQRDVEGDRVSQFCGSERAFRMRS
jgi:hypothetical protein